MRTTAIDALLAQREALFCWVPVCLGIGIGIYFSLSQEPDGLFIATLGVSICVLLVLWGHAPPAIAPLVMAVVLVLTGAGIAKMRVEAVSAPVLTFRYYGPIEGRIANIDRSANDAVRLTLDRVVLARMSPARTPERVRVSLYGDQPLAPFAPGDHMILTGHLSPPAGPAEPGGFDFQRHAWFLQLGAVGYTRTPVLRLGVTADETMGARIFRLRMAISMAVQAAMPGETGAFAAAIMTGDRSGMAQETLTDLRAANLAHLLAISGLHMGLLTGFVFAVIRYGIALVPGLALRVPAKKIAAVLALIVGAFYLALSGGNVATERAFIMVAVMLVAVLLDRRALTLRAVAIAAIIVLIWQPEAMMGPGFQMSFAATTALVAAFAALRRFDLWKLPRWTRPVLSVVVSSFIAGLATAPFAAAHFNQIAHYGLIANVLSVPLMGILVMPAAVLATCLLPFGLWPIGLWLMDKGLAWILLVADVVSARPGALSHIWAPHWAVVPVLTLGLLWALLIRGKSRWGGMIGVVLAAALWSQSTRPALLVADSGGLMGVLSAEGRALSSARGSGFVAGIWLENDGAPVAQEFAAAREGLQTGTRRAQVLIGSWTVLQVSGKTALADIVGCDGADVLVTNQTDTVARPCEVFDQIRLRDTGALAMDLADDGALVIETARHVAGVRAWSGQSARQPQIILASDSKRDAAAPRLSSIAQPDQ